MTRGRLHDGEVVPDGEVEAFGGDLFLSLLVHAEVPDLHQQVTRLAGSERPVDRPVVGFDQMVNRFGVVNHAEFWGHDLKELTEVLLGRIGHFNLVRDARRNAASTRSRGSRLVEKMIS